MLRWRGDFARGRRNLDQGIAEFVRFVRASQRDVVRGLLRLALGQVGIDAQIGRCFIELGDAVSQERCLAKHAHGRKMRGQGIDHVIVGNAIAAIAVGDDAAKPTARHEQAQKRGKPHGPAAAQHVRGLGHQDEVESASCIVGARLHGDESQGAFVEARARRAYFLRAADAGHALGSQANEVGRRFARATADLEHAPPDDHGAQIAVHGRTANSAAGNGLVGHRRALYIKGSGRQHPARCAGPKQ